MAKFTATWSNLHGDTTVTIKDLNDLALIDRLDFLKDIRRNVDNLYERANKDWSDWLNSEDDDGSN